MRIRCDSTFITTEAHGAPGTLTMLFLLQGWLCRALSLLYLWDPQVSDCANTSRTLEGAAAAVGGACLGCSRS